MDIKRSIRKVEAIFYLKSYHQRFHFHHHFKFLSTLLISAFLSIHSSVYFEPFLHPGPISQQPSFFLLLHLNCYLSLTFHTSTSFLLRFASLWVEGSRTEKNISSEGPRRCSSVDRASFQRSRVTVQLY